MCGNTDANININTPTGLLHNRGGQQWVNVGGGQKCFIILECRIALEDVNLLFK